MEAKTFKHVVTLAAVLALLCIGCQPLQGKKAETKQGAYIMTNDRVLGDSTGFRLPDTIIWPGGKYKPLSALEVTDKVLTLGTERYGGRCVRCHTCGFEAAWDIDNYGTPEWSPVYIGEAWAPSVQRMRMLENSVLNEKIADRIYEFLRLETLGEYDESKDDKGAFVIQR